MSSLQLNHDFEVAVVGGGPVGLVTALLLAREGVATALLEKTPDVETDLRASTFHPPTLDLLDDIGLAGDLIAQGLIAPQWQVRLHPEGDRAVFDLGVIANATRHPYRVQCEQWKLSRLALAALRAEPRAEIRFATEVIGRHAGRRRGHARSRRRRGAGEAARPLRHRR